MRFDKGDWVKNAYGSPGRVDDYDHMSDQYKVWYPNTNVVSWWPEHELKPAESPFAEAQITAGTKVEPEPYVTLESGDTLAFTAKMSMDSGITEISDYTVTRAPDMVNTPPHYTSHPSGVECIEITRHMSFALGNAVKYIWRADLKNDAIEDLEKAIFYIKREIELRKGEKVFSYDGD